MACAVRTRRVTAVPLVVPAGEASPQGRRRVALSPLDTRYITMAPHCRIFLFPSPSPPVAFPAIVGALRSSLAEVLPSFYPMAGELTYSPESGAVAIVCAAEDAHVALVEAETDMEFARLVEDDADDIDALRQLAPDILREQLPAPLIAAQVTEFVGGVAVGVAVNHVAADGRGVYRFLEMWAAAAASSEERAMAEEPAARILHDRSLVRFEGDDELGGVYLQQIAPDLPRIEVKVKKHLASLVSRRTFTFTAPMLDRLKQRLAGAGAEAGTTPSTFSAIAAHGLVSIAKSMGQTEEGAMVLAIFPADCRGLMSPPVPDTYAGNCVVTCVAAMSVAELAAPHDDDEEGLTRAFVAIREAIAFVKRDPLEGWGRWFSKEEDTPPGIVRVVVVGSPRLPAFLDFGFGKPVRSELASIHHENQMVLSAGREVGSVQVSVTVATDKMPALREVFALDEC